ncbi:outer membrane protein [Taklimakanibacter lacteus]|uniref:outer membrane protein n=1 Tax=Taklimakanibacter lacteus TaxID=2268456 RepID=UPI000E672DD7
MVKKEYLLAVAATALVLGMSSARAADIEPVAEPAGWYVSLFGGASFLDRVDTNYSYDGTSGYEANVSTDLGFIIGGAVGTHLTDDLRVELEVAYSENDVDDIRYRDGGDGSTDTYDAHGKFGILTFMANFWYDLPLSEEVKPYLGGGLGLAVVDGDVGYDDFDDYDPIFDSSEVAFAFQLGAGLRWQAWDNISLDVGYRLRGIDGPSLKNETSFEEQSDYELDWMWNHNVIAGVSFGL